ncbi:hypothetical protein C4J81_18985 (plasmid) [Deltaproteobacteria bacterium Smac51]|nr:hypothetical protein C4J81_18985 [Deltaproteobacteria bacterium Smac51]
MLSYQKNTFQNDSEMSAGKTSVKKNGSSVPSALKDYQASVSQFAPDNSKPGAPVHKKTFLENKKQSAPPSVNLIQKKGEKPLAEQIEEAGLTTAAEEIEGVVDLIREYDDLADGRPSMQAEYAHRILLHLSGRMDSKNSNHKKLFDLIAKEAKLDKTQAARLSELTKNDEAPYHQMIREGRLWTHDLFKDRYGGISSMFTSPKEYFTGLSKKNIKTALEELSPALSTPYKKKQLSNFSMHLHSFIKRAQAILQTCVISHYFPADRLAALRSEHKLKSKTMLQRDLPSFQHHTQEGFDDDVLGNSGFVFFFLEAPGAAGRNTRFSEGANLRVSIPIMESGLLKSGWLMMTDFAQREFPDIYFDDGAVSSNLSTRPPAPSQKNLLRRFIPGKMSASGLKLTEGAMMKKEPGASAIYPMMLGDELSHQEYYLRNADESKPPKVLQRQERLFQNVLVGRDIIDGLAYRAAVEIMRIFQVNPDAAMAMVTLDGDPLLLLILKHLFRPQALLPRGVAFRDEHILGLPSSSSEPSDSLEVDFSSSSLPPRPQRPPRRWVMSREVGVEEVMMDSVASVLEGANFQERVNVHVVSDRGWLCYINCVLAYFNLRNKRAAILSAIEEHNAGSSEIKIDIHRGVAVGTDEERVIQDIIQKVIGHSYHVELFFLTGPPDHSSQRGDHRIQLLLTGRHYNLIRPR